MTGIQRAIQAIDLPGVQVTPWSITVPPGVSIEAFEGIDKALAEAESSIPLLRGLLYVEAEQRFGHDAAQIVDPTDGGSASQRQWVARNVPQQLRQAAMGPGEGKPLTYSHLRHVAALPVEDMDAWLFKARSKGWTSRELKKAIEGPTEPKPEPPDIPMALRYAQGRVGAEWRQQDMITLSMHLGAIDEA